MVASLHDAFSLDLTPVANGGLFFVAAHELAAKPRRFPSFTLGCPGYSHKSTSWVRRLYLAMRSMSQHGSTTLNRSPSSIGAQSLDRGYERN